MKPGWWLGWVIAFLVVSGCSVANPRDLAQTSISFTIENSRFTPQKWYVPSGEMIQLSVDNPGAKTHRLVILKGSAVGETDPNVEQNQFYSVLVQIQHVELSFQAPAMPGEYRLVCATDSHEIEGERGILVVVIP